jgi:hypothetical protein
MPDIHPDLLSSDPEKHSIGAQARRENRLASERFMLCKGYYHRKALARQDAQD